MNDVRLEASNFGNNSWTKRKGEGNLLVPRAREAAAVLKDQEN